LKHHIMWRKFSSKHVTAKEISFPRVCGWNLEN
jgi:hypothetical protein